MGEQESLDLNDVTPDQFMKLIGNATDEQIEQGLKENWDLLMEGIFSGMRDHFEPDKAEGVSTVVEWRITGKPDVEKDHWQVIIKDGQCTINNDTAETSSVAMELSGVDFVKLAAMQVVGPALFTSGRLKIEGDMIQAAQVQTFFRTPDAVS